jgi:lipopolysaccharide/colanic/teichoic acid biosynthesis glycosyltransferase
MKRFFDFCFSLVSLIISLPLLVIICLGVKCNLGSPILFRQVRPGKDCKPFEMIKFRTMTDAVDHAGNLLPDSERMTPFGHFLRSSSLDELPELWNVLKGDMSLVGPRPLLFRYLPLYSAEQLRRQAVRPGITGLAQVNGRNALDWESKFKLDLCYVDNMSFALDLKILLLTVWVVVKRSGISSDTSVTMEEFTGTLKKEKKDEH